MCAAYFVAMKAIRKIFRGLDQNGGITPQLVDNLYRRMLHYFEVLAESCDSSLAILASSFGM